MSQHLNKESGKLKTKKYKKYMVTGGILLIKLWLENSSSIPAPATRCSRPPTPKWAPWHILRSDNKKRARLNCLSHILKLIPYKKLDRDPIKLPKRTMKHAYDDEAPLKGRKFVPEKY